MSDECQAGRGTMQEEASSLAAAAVEAEHGARSSGDSSDEDDFLSRALKKIMSSRKPPEVDPQAFQKVAGWIRDGSIKKIVVVAGAGISTAAGIPDFRTPGSGLYDNLKKYKLPYPQAVFEIGYFKKNPKPFFALAKELFPGGFKPTTSHYFIKLLQDKNILARHYTQNIDDLEKIAGVTEEHLVQAHGTFSVSHCVKCKTEYDVEWVKPKIFNDEVPKCEKCGGVVKPDIVFFGENLPERFYDLTQIDFLDPDLLIVMGTSLAVSPVNMLVGRVPAKCHKLLINREMVGEDLFTVSWSGKGKEERGIFGTFLGDSDAGCQKLADLIGWGDELKRLVEKGHAELDEKPKADLASSYANAEKSQKL